MNHITVEELASLTGMVTDEVFAVWTNTDLTEGRGAEYVKHFCKREATAKRLAKGSYVMGTDASISKETIFRVGNTFYFPSAFIVMPTAADIIADEKADAERKAAEAKAAVFAKAKALGLTDEEIKLLA